MYTPTIQEEKSSSPRTVPSRTRTGSSDFPDEMPLPVRINSKDIVDVSFSENGDNHILMCMCLSQDTAANVPAKKQKNSVKVAAPQRKRRNSTGTIYLNATMSKQDNNATIQCVCIVIRAHMIDAAKHKSTCSPDYDVFRDSAYVLNNLEREDKQHHSLSLVCSCIYVM